MGAANYSYDANGNLTSDGVRTSKYDNENRLVSRTGAAGGTTTLRYDPRSAAGGGGFRVSRAAPREPCFP